MKTQLSNKDLTSGTVWKRLLLFFLPIAAGTCIQQLYNAVDGLIVGRFVGTVALAAVGGSSAQVINVLIGFFVAVTAGASVVIAQIYGAGRMEDVRDASGNAITIFGILGILLAVFGILAAPFLLKLLQKLLITVEYPADHACIRQKVFHALRIEQNVQHSRVTVFIHCCQSVVESIILFFYLFFLGLHFGLFSLDLSNLILYQSLCIRYLNLFVLYIARKHLKLLLRIFEICDSFSSFLCRALGFSTLCFGSLLSRLSLLMSFVILFLAHSKRC